jgi:hypothetical protein
MSLEYPLTGAVAMSFAGTPSRACTAIQAVSWIAHRQKTMSLSNDEPQQSFQSVEVSHRHVDVGTNACDGCQSDMAHKRILCAGRD